MSFAQTHVVHAVLVEGNQSTHLIPLVLPRASTLSGCTAVAGGFGTMFELQMDRVCVTCVTLMFYGNVCLLQFFLASFWELGKLCSY